MKKMKNFSKIFYFLIFYIFFYSRKNFFDERKIFLKNSKKIFLTVRQKRSIKEKAISHFLQKWRKIFVWNDIIRESKKMKNFC